MKDYKICKEANPPGYPPDYKVYKVYKRIPPDREDYLLFSLHWYCIIITLGLFTLLLGFPTLERWGYLGFCTDLDEAFELAEKDRAQESDLSEVYYL